MRLYNTLTKTVENLDLLSPPSATIYTCGPTVYDYPHIGNWFTFIRYDLLVRTMKDSGLKPNWVMNITDVGHLVSDADEGEDKLEKGAKREGKTAWEVATSYTEYFEKGLERLNISQPDKMPKATEHIPEQITLIQNLEQKGFTYVISDGVYFDTTKFEAYAVFARLNLEELQEGARVEANPEKHSPTDFALWKLSPKETKRDMEWDSPWGKGFPGWHLECSAMSMKYLGETIDIHSGGIDHIPVHHTNEIAQSEAATGKRFANYWMHTNHISVDGEKISKSLNNSITLENIEQKGFSLQAFRLLVLESHYRTHSKFSYEALEAAQNRLNAYQAMADHKWQLDETGKVDDQLISSVQAEIQKAMQEDLNTPQSLAILSSLETAINTNGISASAGEVFEKFLEWLDALLGFSLSNRKDITPEQKELINSRQHARDRKDWDKSDKIRHELEQQGISIKDNELRQVWHKLRL